MQHRPSGWVRRTALALCLAGAAAGCGSTVQVRGTVTTGALDPGAATSSAPTLAPGSTSPEGNPGGATTGSVGPGGSAVPQQPGGGAGPAVPGARPTSAGPTGTGPISGQGFDAHRVFVGIEYSSDFGGFMSSAGFSSISSGDNKALAERVIAYLNSHGGVLGRSIVPVFHNTSSASTASNPNIAAQATCSDLTQDHKVVAALVISTSAACLAKAHVVSARAAIMQPVDQAFADNDAPYVYFPTADSYTYLTPTWLDRLTAQGYFSPGAKIGLLYAGAGAGHEAEPRIERELKRQLVARGITVAAEFGYDASDPSTQASSPPQAVLPFRSKGVDHVIALGAAVSIFMNAAEQQGYRPRYAINSYMNIASVLQTVPPKAQLTGAVGVGWSPANDVDSGPGRAASPGRRLCDDLIKQSGQAGATGSALVILLSYCEAIRLFAFAADAGGGFSAPQLHAGMARKGASFPSALNLASAYSARRYDGAAAVRDIAYVPGCSCFQYTSTTTHPA